MSAPAVLNELTNMGFDINRNTLNGWLEKLINEWLLSSNADTRHLAEQHLQDKATRKKEREESKQNNGIKITYEEFKTNDQTKQLAEQYLQEKMSGGMVHKMLTKMGIDVGKSTVSTWLKKFQEERLAADDVGTSNHPNQQGSSFSNESDAFREFSNVFGVESNADDGSLYSMIRPTQSKRG
ncbi:hypothetical protein GPALN_005919 [Globodera pallida]|nr:hypothetical protein GPALN_005919 [Globodera pallida]